MNEKNKEILDIGKRMFQKLPVFQNCLSIGVEWQGEEGKGADGVIRLVEVRP